MPIVIILASISGAFLLIALVSRTSADQDAHERQYDAYLIFLALVGLAIAAARFAMLRL